MGEGLDRRQFLRLAGAGAVCAAAGSACSSGSGSKGQLPNKASDASRPAATRKQLRIAQVGHFVPGYDTWFDHEYTPAWGERNDVEVIVDHFPVEELAGRAAAEANARRGHDLFGINRPATVEAVKVAKALWSGGQALETLSWNEPSANNRLLASGKGSLILNPVSGLRAVEKQDPAIARTIGLVPPLAGPAARRERGKI